MFEQLKNLLFGPSGPTVPAIVNTAWADGLMQLESTSHVQLLAIAKAIREAISPSLSQSEEQILAAIERRREVLLSSDQELDVIDYGAGSPNSRRTNEEMNQGVLVKRQVSKIALASKPGFWARLLFHLIRNLKPQHCVELGTCVGISASYQSTALKLNGRGDLVTLEGSPEIANLAKQTLDLLSLKNAKVVTGPFHSTLQSVLAEAQPIDFFFNDGHHDKEAVIRYHQQALPYLANDAVLVLDDISWSPGMNEAWQQVIRSPEVTASINLQTIGIALVNRNISRKLHLQFTLPEQLN